MVGEKMFCRKCLFRAQSQETDRLETRELAVLRSLYPFLFTGDQNVNKPKSRVATTVNRAIYLLFYKIIVSFFSFFYEDVNKTRANCAIIGYNLSKEHKLALYKTENGEPNYIDKFFFTFCKELRVQKLGTKLASWLMHVLCDFKAT